MENLQNYISVDVFGKCGPLKCEDGMDCFVNLAKSYKFYLAFENSLCSEYVTEKFWRTLRLPLLPGSSKFQTQTLQYSSRCLPINVNHSRYHIRKLWNRRLI